MTESVKSRWWCDTKSASRGAACQTCAAQVTCCCPGFPVHSTPHGRFPSVCPAQSPIPHRVICPTRPRDRDAGVMRFCVYALHHHSHAPEKLASAIPKNIEIQRCEACGPLLMGRGKALHPSAKEMLGRAKRGDDRVRRPEVVYRMCAELAHACATGSTPGRGEVWLGICAGLCNHRQRGIKDSSQPGGGRAGKCFCMQCLPEGPVHLCSSATIRSVPLSALSPTP